MKVIDISRVARFLAAKYGRLLSIPDVRQAQCDAISCVCVRLFRSVVTMAVSLAISDIFSVKEWPDLGLRSFKVIDREVGYKWMMTVCCRSLL